MAEVLISLGSNLGPREEILQRAVDLLGASPGICLRAVSPWLATRAVGGPPGQPDFLNGAALVETSLSPQALLGRLLQIETQLGRVRDQRWGPRTLDLDVLLYDDLVVETSTLQIPHPAMAWRRFVLEPAALVAGRMVHPRIGWTVQELFDHLRTAPPYLATAGCSPELHTRLARQLAEPTGAELLSGGQFVEELRKAFSPGFLCGSRPPNQTGLVEELRQAFSPGFGKVHAPSRPDSPRFSPSTASEATQSIRTVIEWLEFLAELLVRDHPRWTTGRWVISDFWLPQCLAWAEALPGQETEKDLQRLWNRVHHSTMSPKLLILFEQQTPGSLPAQCSPGVSPTEVSCLQPNLSEGSFPRTKACPTQDAIFLSHRPLKELLNTAWRGPILRIPLADPEEDLSQATSEVQIAMEAVQ